MTLRLLNDSRPRGADRAHARRRALTGRPRAARGAQPGCRRRFLQRNARPVSYGAPPALVTLTFSTREVIGRLTLLRLTSALLAPWHFLKDVVPGLWARVAGNRSHAKRPMTVA